MPHLLARRGRARDAEAMCRELLESGDGNKTTLANVTRGGRTIHCEWYNTPLVDAERQASSASPRSCRT